MAPSDTAACLPVPAHPLWERTVFNVHSLSATPPHICKVLFLGWVFQAHVYVEPCHPPAMALALLAGPKWQLDVKVATKSHACRKAEQRSGVEAGPGNLDLVSESDSGIALAWSIHLTHIHSPERLRPAPNTALTIEQGKLQAVLCL